MSFIAWFDDALAARLDLTAQAWLAAQVAAVASGADPALSIARAGRACGHKPLPPGSPLTEWDLTDLDTGAAARIRVALAIPGDAQAFTTALDRLFKAATLAEAAALYRGLPAYPYPESHAARAAEGIRSNMCAVYEAVALGNPYAAAWLDEMAFNQMVLKAFFVGADARRIVGLDRRWNPRLHAMLAGYVHERELARRAVDPFLAELVADNAEQDSLSATPNHQPPTTNHS
jgi:hypothetical protein